MYEILFICDSCNEHFRASADDAGYEFLCPMCNTPLCVPSGDLLFSCKSCGAILLASAASIGDTFECPGCSNPVRVPTQGKTIEFKEHLELPIIKASSAQIPPKMEHNEDPDHELTKEGEREFMTKWGDFMAEAGLANKPDDSPKNVEPRGQGHGA